MDMVPLCPFHYMKICKFRFTYVGYLFQQLGIQYGTVENLLYL